MAGLARRTPARLGRRQAGRGAAALVALGMLVAPGVVAALGPAAVAAQSTLDRTPNVDGVWTGAPGVVHFHFLHRFQVTPPPARKVLNSPTFLLAAGLPGGFLGGGRYVTNSLLVAGQPNAWELFGRWASPAEGWRAPVAVSVELARNWAAESWDGELLLGRRLGPLGLLAGARGFSSFAGTETGRWAAVGGVTVRLHRNVALAGDVARVMDDDARDTAWGAGLQLAIPTTPHTVSLQVSNANTTTLQGASVGVGDRRWGFEFTAPVTLARYFGGGRSGGGGGPVAGASAVSASASAGAASSPAAAVVDMDNRLRYLPDTVRVRVGDEVVWRNGSDLIHTVTADPVAAAKEGSVRLPAGAEPFDSGELRPGSSFTHRFTVPGEYRYVCLPHEAAGMVGTVIVEGGG